MSCCLCFVQNFARAYALDAELTARLTSLISEHMQQAGIREGRARPSAPRVAEDGIETREHQHQEQQHHRQHQQPADDVYF